MVSIGQLIGLILIGVEKFGKVKEIRLILLGYERVARESYIKLMPSPRPDHNQEFFNHLMGQDDLGVIIRAHIEIENVLNRFLEYVCHDFALIEQISPDYFDKVCLALALGLNDEYGGVLKALGNLRNEFAHKLEAEINKSNVSSLYEAFPPDGKKIIQDAYNRTRKRLPKSKMVKSAKKLSPKSKFAVIATTLRSFLISSLEERRSLFKEGMMELDCECGNRLIIPLQVTEQESLNSVPFSCCGCRKEFIFNYNWGWTDSDVLS